MVIVQGLSFFAEHTVTADIYVNILELFALLQIEDLEQEEGEILFQQSGAPSHFGYEVQKTWMSEFVTGMLDSIMVQK